MGILNNNRRAQSAYDYGTIQKRKDARGGSGKGETDARMGMYIGMFLVYGAAHVYVGRRTLAFLRTFWPGLRAWPFWTVSVLPLLCLGLGGLLGWYPVQCAGFIWLGVVMYATLGLLAADAGGWCLRRLGAFATPQARKRARQATGCVLAALVAATVGYGMVHARQIQVHTVAFTVQKASTRTGLRVAVLSDLHLGDANGPREVERIVQTVNGMQADLVCLVGDTVDTHLPAHAAQCAALLRNLKSRYGVYACLGNHDVDALTSGTNAQVLAFLQQANIQVLQDEAVLIDDAFYLVGRLDEDPIGVGETNRKSPQELTAALDPSKPILMMDHRPKEYEAAAAAGVDVDMSGHSHGGQLFPVTLLTDAMYALNWGYRQMGSLHAVTTCGVGFWGPPMRIGTDCEIVQMEIAFSPPH